MSGFPEYTRNEISGIRPGQAWKWRSPGIASGACGLAKSFLHPLVPAVVVAVEAVSVDAVQDFDTVTCPFGDLRAGRARVEAPGDPGVAEVVGLAGQREVTCADVNAFGRALRSTCQRVEGW